MGKGARVFLLLVIVALGAAAVYLTVTREKPSAGGDSGEIRSTTPETTDQKAEEGVRVEEKYGFTTETLGN